jgi:hypothetical protein
MSVMGGVFDTELTPAIWLFFCTLFSSQQDNDKELKRSLTEILDGSRDIACLNYVASRLTAMIESASQENSENSNASCDNISESEEGDGANMDTKGCDDYSSSRAAVPESIHSEGDCSLSGSDSHDSENEDDVAEGKVTYPRPVDNYSNPGSRHHQPPLPLSQPCRTSSANRNGTSANRTMPHQQTNGALADCIMAWVCGCRWKCECG